MMCGENIGLVKFLIVSLAALSLIVGLIGVISPGWYIYEGKLLNYELKMIMTASKMFSEKTKRTEREIPDSFDSWSMPAKAPSGEDNSNGSRLSNPASEAMPAKAPAGTDDDNNRLHPALRGTDGNGMPPPKRPDHPDNDDTGKDPPPPERPELPNNDNGKNPSNDANPDGAANSNDGTNQGDNGNKGDMSNRLPDMNAGDNDGHADDPDEDGHKKQVSGKDDEGHSKDPSFFRLPTKNRGLGPRPLLQSNETRPTNRPLLPSRTKPTKPPIGNRPDILQSNHTMRPGIRPTKPGFLRPTRPSPPPHKLPPLNISWSNVTNHPLASRWPPGLTMKTTRIPNSDSVSDLEDPPKKPDRSEGKDGHLDWFTGDTDKLTGAKNKPDWVMGILDKLKGGNFSDFVWDKLDKVDYSVHLGLWFGKICDKADGVTACDGESLSKLFGKLKTPDVSLSTWNDMRLESALSMVFCVLGLIATIMTVKPLCLKTKPRIPVIIAVCGMLLSCVLLITAISRIASIHVHVNEILEDKHSSDHLLPGVKMPTKPCHLSTPWSVVLCGIAAGLAFATALTLGLFIWRQERMRWYKFNPDGDLAKNDGNKEVYTDISSELAQDNKAFEPTIGNSNV